jgi:hypothetical protein
MTIPIPEIIMFRISDHSPKLQGRPQARAAVLVLLVPANSGRATARDVVPARNEGADDYRSVVAQIDARTRVIEGACGIQWVVQRSVSRARGREWRGVSFCRTKETLLRCAGHHPALVALPDRYPEGRILEELEAVDDFARSELRRAKS